MKTKPLWKLIRKTSRSQLEYFTATLVISSTDFIDWNEFQLLQLKYREKVLLHKWMLTILHGDATFLFTLNRWWVYHWIRVLQMEINRERASLFNSIKATLLFNHRTIESILLVCFTRKFSRIFLFLKRSSIFACQKLDPEASFIRLSVRILLDRRFHSFNWIRLPVSQTK